MTYSFLDGLNRTSQEFEVRFSRISSASTRSRDPWFQLENGCKHALVVRYVPVWLLLQLTCDWMYHPLERLMPKPFPGQQNRFFSFATNFWTIPTSLKADKYLTYYVHVRSSLRQYSWKRVFTTCLSHLRTKVRRTPRKEYHCTALHCTALYMYVQRYLRLYTEHRTEEL